MKLIIDLQQFAGERSGEAGATAVKTAAAEQAATAWHTAGASPTADKAANPAAANPAANTAINAKGVTPRNAPADGSEDFPASPEPNRAELYRRFKTDFKSEYDAEVQGIVRDRLKKLSEFRNKAQRVFSALADKYGGDAGDPDSLLRAMEEDGGGRAGETPEKDVPASQPGQSRERERADESLRRAQPENARLENGNQIYVRWMQEAEQAKKLYPKFDLRTESGNPAFLRLLKSGVDVRTAFEVIHKDEIIPAAMSYTAKKTEQAVMNKIAAQGMRPSENGLSAVSAVTLSKNPGLLTKEERADLKRRVRNGEKIRW